MFAGMIYLTFTKKHSGDELMQHSAALSSETIQLSATIKN